MNMLFRFLGSDNIAFRELFFTDAKIDIEVIRDDESGFVAQKAIYDCNKKIQILRAITLRTVSLCLYPYILKKSE
ncbi:MULTISPECIES: hypothetical protein [Campylobacter]|uniref:hypothetical protein n=1 Tax=Campylobacter TaxID=194 RepID=UPI0002F8B877|nr:MULTISPECIES: hypothetical protein [Campylobacter]KGT36514.1 hypothetical protein KU70_05355 [Campylobacter fetus]MDV2490705.1 hypothetical protein [Campylobacter sp. TJR-1]HDX6330140.1 hypothetical protein [Campylobacter fetus subsp. venerealis]